MLHVTCYMFKFIEFIDVTENNKNEYNAVVAHPLQSFEWGEFRKKTGVKVIRRAMVQHGEIMRAFTLTLHKIPKTKLYIGYLPKGSEPTEEILNEISRIARLENCIFVQFEPNLKADKKWKLPQRPEFDAGEEAGNWKLVNAAHPLFTKYTFVLDLTKQEEELLAQMHSKTRYNIKVAQKHGIKVLEDNSQDSFKTYLKLMTETTNRQAFYAHTPSYHKNLFETLPKKDDTNSLSYHLLNAVYKPKQSTIANQQSIILTSWVLFVFKDTLYYPYGASSRQYRETMASNLMAWEAIKFGKKLGLKKFDMWGALGPEPSKNDPWYGFHRFKEGYGAELVEYVGSYDLVVKPLLYELYKAADKIRWGLLRLLKRLLG